MKTIMREIYLKFNEEERYDVKIETIEEMNKSIFLDHYIQAYKELNTISSENDENKIDRNNILAFLGERGSGKTSCMKSFLNLLKPENIKAREDITNIELKNNIEPLSKFKFEVLTIIEPSFFSEKVNIIELVVSSMFKNFSVEIEKNNRDYEIKRTLLKTFQEIFKNMKYMKCSEEYQNSEIEELMALGTAVDFKTHLNKLIQVYLEFFSKDKLVIAIDDIDLNTKFAYFMIEDIRKYLSIPNVIIILALKLEQLKTVITKEYIEEYKHLLDDNSFGIDDYNRYIMEDIENRVEKYLLKLIPYERRIFLKNINDHEYNFKFFIGKREILSKSQDFQDIILEMIYKKTNILFLKPIFGCSQIIPTTLRELVGFIAIIEKLDDIENNIDNKKKNYKIFKNYIFNYYFKDKLKIIEEKIIQKLLKIEYSQKNDYICNKLKPREYFVERVQTNENMTLIDVIKSIQKLEKRNDSNFAFFLKVVYSFLLYESYYSLERESFSYLLGKNFLQSFPKLILFKADNSFVSNDKYKILQYFIFKTENGERNFSLIAPLYNFAIKNIENKENDINSEDRKNLVFRNMEIYERLYIFLDNIDFEIEKDKKLLWEKILKFYKEDIYNFIGKCFLPDQLENKIKSSIKIFEKKLLDITADDFNNIKGLDFVNSLKKENRKNDE